MKKYNKHTFPESRPNHLLILDKLKIPMKIFNQQQKIDSPLLDFCCERTQQLRKNQIKVSKNKLPSDFFKTDKPATVSSSLNQRIKRRETMTSPNKNKKQLNTSQVGTAYDQDIKDQDSFFIKLTNCFKNQVSQFSSQNRICFTERKYQSHNHVQSNNEIPFEQMIKGHRRQRSLGKPSFFDSSKPTSQKIQIQFPSIRSATVTNSLRKRIQNSKICSDNIGFDNKRFKGDLKLSAIMANSSIQNQIRPVYFSLVQNQNNLKNTLQPNYNKDEMMITFCNLNKTSHFFQQ